MSSHARLAPSAFKAYEVCPSYLPDDETTKAAERGEMLHKVMQGKLKPCDAQLTEEDERHLEQVQDYIAPFLSGLSPRSILREVEIDLRSWNIPDCTHGTGDLLLLRKSERKIDLVDYKFGWWEVDDPESNIQTGIYSLGVFARYSWCDQITVHILQPGRDEVGTALINRPEIPTLLLRAKTIAQRVIRLSGKEFNPTVDYCPWCDRKATCHVLQEFALKARDHAQIDPSRFEDLTAQSFNDLAQSGEVYDFATVLEKWASAIKYKITQMAINGDDVPGHDLRETRGKRTIVDQHTAYDILKQRYKVKLAEFLSACEPSLTKLMKIIRAKAPDRQKALREQEASNVLMDEGVIAQGSPNAFLVRRK